MKTTLFWSVYLPTQSQTDEEEQPSEQEEQRYEGGRATKTKPGGGVGVVLVCAGMIKIDY